MKLLTKEIAEKLESYPLHSQDGKFSEAVVVAKFFYPAGSWTWYVLEGKKLPNDDYEFFGIVNGFEIEYGYFTLKELKNIVGAFGLRVERDAYFDSCKVCELDDEKIKSFVARLEESNKNTEK